MQKVLIALVGIIIGVLGTYLIASHIISVPLISPQKQVIGFLPYWLLDKMDKDYSKFITTLAYFSLTIDTDGSILKLSSPQETEPGWNALKSGKLDVIFSNMTKNRVKLSLVVFAGDEQSIYSLIDDPIPHAKNLVDAVAPVMKQYSFSDLNLDIESSKEASEEARLKFTQFIREVKNGLDKNQLGTLTVDVSPTIFIKKYLIDPNSIGSIADYILIMGYDYHYPGSLVTGPVAPLYGAGSIAEFDTNVPVQLALKIIPKQKIILGLPLYGYEWETITNFPRSATIPASSLISSNRRVEQFLKSCATCSAQVDNVAKEQYLIYRDAETGTYHQVFYPDKQSMIDKVSFTKEVDLGGIGLWALGYEGSTILEGLSPW
ncbi:hypothetical protein HYT74_01860 [Candidatus Daviesbacteria bacterium]|nr:hypothetical protein [Candidatus Daviesbacteria bacterium]